MKLCPKNTYDGKFQICLMNDSLYDGLAGVCLFYNTLYGYSHNPKHKEIAGRIFSQLCKSREESYKGVDTESIPISPLSGITGLVYIMERFNELYDKSVYSSIVDEVKRLIPQTTQYDFMSGLAGLVLFIVQCKKIGERDRTDILMMCADRLTTLETEKGGIAYWTYNEGNDIIGRKKMVLGGFAHGSSSMSLAMFLLYKHLGDSKYYEVYRQSLLHDRSFYSEQIKGWIDGRNPEVPVDSGSWCHGAAGIALSRLILMSMGCQDPYLRKELEVAVGQIRKRIGYNLSVCHGSMGNLEVLQSIMRLKKGNGSDCIGWINAIAKSVYQGNDIICGDDNRNSQVGLFMGFAGIGYQFLRFYDWKNVPSLLCLEVTPKISLLHGE